MPDILLFEGGAGEAICRKLLHKYDVHTLLRLPTGIYYAQGVKANVLFFDRKPASEKPWTEKLWIYDLRTNRDFSLKQRPLTRADLDEFVACYHPENRHERKATWSEISPQERWRAFALDELMARDKVNLDIFWLRDESLKDSASLPEPDVLAAEIVEDLQSALEQFAAIGGRHRRVAALRRNHGMRACPGAPRGYCRGEAVLAQRAGNPINAYGESTIVIHNAGGTASSSPLRARHAGGNGTRLKYGRTVIFLLTVPQDSAILRLDNPAPTVLWDLSPMASSAVHMRQK